MPFKKLVITSNKFNKKMVLGKTFFPEQNYVFGEVFINMLFFFPNFPSIPEHHTFSHLILTLY